jgi:hypothetical protein
LLFGGTALCAKLIDLPASHITLWRSVIAIGALVVMQRFRGKPILLDRRRDYLVQIGLGLVLGLHWWWSYSRASKARPST